jgi:tetratricopeptide (TPR) repeat protein
MTQTPSQPSPPKGKAFFDRADQIAESGNWDFAIEMYLEGIQREPGNVERGHKPLRAVAMNRKAKGGKPAGMMEQLKRRGGKEPLGNLVNAEYMLSKDPGNVAWMEQVLKFARELNLDDVIRWIAEILLESQRVGRPALRVCLAVTDAFEALKEYQKAVAAAELAQQLAPNDNEIAGRIKDLSTQYTIQKGGYDQGGSFEKGIKDIAAQKKLMEQDSAVKSESYKEQQLKDARAGYEANPVVAGKINAVVDALLAFEDEGCENEAADILAKAHRDTKAYAFKMRIGDIRIKQAKRRYRALSEAGDKPAAAAQLREVLKIELDEYAERAANYPTDMAIKFELGSRLFLAGRVDEAIGALQQARRDPRRQVQAIIYLGRAFDKKGWRREAVETLQEALNLELTEERAKEVRYYLGNVLEEMGELAKAQEQFSAIALVDFNYKDVRQRLDDLRRKLNQ